MQNFRLLPAIVAVTLCASPILTRADDTPQQAAARAAMMQQMNGGDTGVQDTNVPAITAPQPETMPATPPPPAYVPPPAPATPPPMSVTPPLAAPSPVMTNMTMDTQYPVNPAPTASQSNTSPIVVPPAPSENPPTAAPATSTMFPASTPAPATPVASPAPAAAPLPMTAPPLPVTATQQQALQDLLSQYEANQITPAQYQAQRAKILSGQ
jgi:hypothetical protein